MSFKILFLTLNTFDSTGGIQNVCRSMSHALSRLSDLRRPVNFEMYTLNDKHPEIDYLKPNQFFGYKGNKALFTINAVSSGLRTDTLIISHINLIPIAFIVKLLSRKTTIVMMAHGTEVWRKITPWKTRFLKKNVTIWAVSSFTKDQLIDIHGIDQEQISVLSNCLDPFFKPPTNFCKPIRLLEKYNLHADQPVLLAIARQTKFDKNKGYDRALEILQQLASEFPDIRYLICGEYDQPEKFRLEQLIKKHELETIVTLVNFVPKDELVEHYLLADVFVLPSKKEGFGLVFIEAAACGCKVISGNKDGSSEAMINGKLGKQVDPDCLTQLKEAIEQSLREPLDHNKSRKIQRHCLENFSHAKYTQKVKKLLFQHG